MRLRRAHLALALALVLGCGGSSQPQAPRGQPTQRAGAVTISIVGTNDLHGAIGRLPLLAGYVSNLREARRADGGAVIVVDAGDMFQGTLESNLAEGADIVRAYNTIGYHAAAVGNHEFDYGPAGPAATPATPDDDARGALKARAREAKFPIMTSNILDAGSSARIKWPNMPASTMVDLGSDIKVGIIGASTEATPFTTMPANFVGLAMAPAAQEIASEAKALRAAGATLVVVTAHIGSKCQDLEHPNDTTSCDSNEELFRVIKDLPKGLVDVFVAGHTHAAIAHRISDIAVIESYSSGRAFGRVDLRIAADGHVAAVKVHKPQLLCPGENLGENPMSPDQCKPGEYEGRPVTVDRMVQTIADEAIAKAQKRRADKLGVTLAKAVTKSYKLESAEGNWFTDLMLAAEPTAQVAVTNGGGLRADMPAGELTYGSLFEAMPFDNRFALVDLKGSHLRKLIAGNLQRDNAWLSWGGLTAKAACQGGALEVTVLVGGKPLDDNRAYKLVTSDFLASGGDGLIGRLKLPEGSIKLTDSIIRDAMVEVLKKQKGAVIDPDKLAKRRIEFPGQRPLACGPKDGKRTRDTEEPD